MTASTIESPVKTARTKPSRAKRSRADESALIRRIFRIHFYAGAIAGPFLLLLAVTGLVILYTDPIRDLLHSDLLHVADSSQHVALQQQVDAAMTAFPHHALMSVVPPLDGSRSTLVALAPLGSDIITNVFVNPHTGAVLGSQLAEDDIVGLANRLHGGLNNEAITVSLPSIAHLIDSSENPDSWVKIPVGSLVMELVAVWALVMLISGIYLWWPRSTTPVQRSRPKVGVRWKAGGRNAIMDIHAAVGLLAVAFMTIFITTGLPWSDYWGESWGAAASKLTPNQQLNTNSTPVRNSQLNSPGLNKEWGGLGDHVAASDASAVAPISLSEVAEIGTSLGMLPGYSIDLPSNSTADGATTYGSFALANHWPQELSERRTVYLDQFSGNVLADKTVGTMGALNAATSYGVNLHMGTQYGLINRILTTLGALLVITLVLTSYMLWWKRRRPGTVGLPPESHAAARGLPALVVVGVTLGIIYPSFGASLVAIVAIEWLRQRSRFRATAGRPVAFDR